MADGVHPKVKPAQRSFNSSFFFMFSVYIGIFWFANTYFYTFKKSNETACFA